MKKYLIQFLTIVSLVAMLPSVNAVEENKLSFIEIIKSANQEFKEKYRFNYEFYDSRVEVSEEVYEKYNILVCSINGISEHGNKDKNGEYRFLGYDPYGESIENPDYYYDALSGENFEKFKWISEPWDETDVIKKYNIYKSRFDFFAQDFRDIFLYGFEYYHGENGVFGNHLGNGWEKLPWESYYHIPIAPTENTRGVAWLFHRERNGSIWYTSAWLPPLSELGKDAYYPTETAAMEERAIIAHNTPSTSVYDVTQAIPTNENLYTQVFADEFITELQINKVSGIHSYKVRVRNGTDEFNNPKYKTVTRHIPYSYYKIVHLELYSIDRAEILNYSLPEGKTILKPNEAYYNKPVLEFDRKGGYSASNGSVTVWNDKLIINGNTILDSSKTSQHAPEPNKLIIPLTKDKALYKDNIIINPILPNKANNSSTTTVYYSYLGGITEGATKKVLINTNPVTIHTPSFCDGGILNDTDFDQSIEIKENRASVILGRPTKLQFITNGQHINVKGYGKREYKEHLLKKQVKLPFDIYIDTKKEEPQAYLKANTWYDIALDKEYIDAFVPSWVKEGSYTVEYRSIPINGLGNTKTQKTANISLNNYIATDSSDIEIIGRVYGFRISDVEDYPLWEKVFRKSINSNVHSGTYYYSGNKDENNISNNIKLPYTLPLLTGSHPYVKNEGALPVGYSFKFELFSMGNYFNEKDCIQIIPRFYYVPQRGGKRIEVDLWYNEFFNGKNNYYVKCGSQEDEKNIKYIYLRDGNRNITERELAISAKNLGILESEFLKLKAKIGWFYRIILAKPLRTFIGDERGKMSVAEESAIQKSVQKWYGEYYIPDFSRAVKKGFDVIAYARQNNGLSGNEAFWLKDGYLVLNLDIHTIKNGDFSKPVLSYGKSTRCNMWRNEGYSKQKATLDGRVFDLEYGDIVFYNLSRKASDYYNPEKTH